MTYNLDCILVIVGAEEELVVKFADGGPKKRQQQQTQGFCFFFLVGPEQLKFWRIDWNFLLRSWAEFIYRKW